MADNLTYFWWQLSAHQYSLVGKVKFLPFILLAKFSHTSRQSDGGNSLCLILEPPSLEAPGTSTSWHSSDPQGKLNDQIIVPFEDKLSVPVVTHVQRAASGSAADHIVVNIVDYWLPVSWKPSDVVVRKLCASHDKAVKVVYIHKPLIVEIGIIKTRLPFMIVTWPLESSRS